MVARASVGHLSLAIALALALAPCALAGNPCTCKTCLDSTGEAVCQGHGYSESECLALGNSCCAWNPTTNPADHGWPAAPGTSTGACWSDIGDWPCPLSSSSGVCVCVCVCVCMYIVLCVLCGHGQFSSECLHCGDTPRKYE